MKKILLLVSICISCSSCCTLFSSSKQDITFTGMNGTKIYEASTKQKIAEIKEDNSVTVQIKRKEKTNSYWPKRKDTKPLPLSWNLLSTMPACGIFYSGPAS